MTRSFFAKLSCSILALSMCAAPACFADASLIEKGDNEHDKGNYDDAIQIYRRTIDQEPMNAVRAGDRLWRLFAKLHRYEESIKVLQDQLARTHNSVYKAQLAELYRNSGDFYGAQRQYEDLLAENPANQYAMLGVGECLEATGNYEAARDYYGRAANIEGESTAVARQMLTRVKGAKSVTTIDVDAEIGKWPATRMPLKVFIQEPGDLSGYRPQLRGLATQAVADWNGAARGLLKMEVITQNSETADIVMSWVERIPGALGVTSPHYGIDGNLRRATILLACNTDATGRVLPAEGTATRAVWEARDRMVREVALHELGHALGLDHSARNDDIMANGVFGMNSADVPFARQLQPGDVERLVQLYTAPESANQKLIATIAAKIAAAKAAKAAATTTIPNAAKTPVDGGPPNCGGFNSGVTSYSDPKADAMRSAIFNMGAGNYSACADQLKKLISEDPKNAQAHYLLAVALVNMRQYSDAGKQYQEVLRIEPKGKLADLAQIGLSKIKQ